MTDPIPVIRADQDDALAAWDLGAGETAVLSIARQNGWSAVIDDGAA